MPAISGQAAPITGNHIDRREIADQCHGDASGAGKAGKLDIQCIAGRYPNNTPPFPGIGGHDGTRFIAGKAHKIADFRYQDRKSVV